MTGYHSNQQVRPPVTQLSSGQKFGKIKFRTILNFWDNIQFHDCLINRIVSTTSVTSFFNQQNCRNNNSLELFYQQHCSDIVWTSVWTKLSKQQIWRNNIWSSFSIHNQLRVTRINLSKCSNSDVLWTLKHGWFNLSMDKFQWSLYVVLKSDN